MDRLTSKTFQQKDSSNKWQFCTKVCVSPKLVTLFLRYIRAEYKDNKNASTGRANSKKATRHHAHFPLIAKSRKSNDGQSRKEQKNPKLGNFLTISTSNISKLQLFLKNRFHSNWRSCLVPTSGQKPKKLLEPFFEKNIEVYDFGLILDLFANISKSRIFFKNPALWLSTFIVP